jgi:hypothetical protein
MSSKDLEDMAGFYKEKTWLITKNLIDE